jgi:hypothetical protein
MHMWVISYLSRVPSTEDVTVLTKQEGEKSLPQTLGWKDCFSAR